MDRPSSAASTETADVDAIATTTVLVVEYDDDARDIIASWLERAGYDVEACPGPSAPGYTCLGGCGRPCPLTSAADVVVLNMRLGSDEVMAGTPAWQLLCYYVAHDKRVVALADERDFVHPFSDQQVVVLRQPLGPEQLLDALMSLKAMHGRGSRKC